MSLLAPDENQLSRMLADLVDPNGTHGQGSKFLSEFLKRAGIGVDVDMRVRVRRECPTVMIERNRRRIDILIEGRNWGVAIENKPWAVEQPDQYPDYVQELKRRFGNEFYLVRLIGADAPPQSLGETAHARLASAGKFITWRFDQDLRGWLTACQDVCEAARVTAFLEELKQFIASAFDQTQHAGGFMDDKTLLPELKKILAARADNIISAAVIAELFPAIRQRWVEDIFNSVDHDVTKALGEGWIFERGSTHFVETNWAKFQLCHKSWAGFYRICLESQPENRYVVLGVWHDADKGVGRNDELRQALTRLGFGDRPGGKYWECHSPLHEPFRDWTSPSTAVALATRGSELVEILTKDFVRLARAFESRIRNLAQQLG